MFEEEFYLIQWSGLMKVSIKGSTNHNSTWGEIEILLDGWKREGVTLDGVQGSIHYKIFSRTLVDVRRRGVTLPGAQGSTVHSKRGDKGLPTAPHGVGDRIPFRWMEKEKVVVESKRNANVSIEM
ncbi:hypothetical protein NPIL_137881 [Nephila pilipes]|uniref:Uncharacterized protein n=1 Tax=Nephila pilipes TaxID=299642 RepID=A0A8X6Q3V9_NEPPI|nr:hypothetical protein NPIL_137881 [Nephila pilipes]